jgi:glycosyltransferase involved in cell wall biosynthesis
VDENEVIDMRERLGLPKES